MTFIRQRLLLFAGATILAGCLQTAGAPPASAFSACAVDKLAITCTLPMVGEVTCEFFSSTYCAGFPNPGVLCVPDVGDFASAFCDALEFNGGNCESAFSDMLTEHKVCCVDSCNDCSSSTDCSAQ